MLESLFKNAALIMFIANGSFLLFLILGSFAQDNKIVGTAILVLLMGSFLTTLASLPLVATKWWLRGLTGQELYLVLPGLLFFILVLIYLFLLKGVFSSRGI